MCSFDWRKLPRCHRQFLKTMIKNLRHVLSGPQIVHPCNTTMRSVFTRVVLDFFVWNMEQRGILWKWVYVSFTGDANQISVHYTFHCCMCRTLRRPRKFYWYAIKCSSKIYIGSHQPLRWWNSLGTTAGTMYLNLWSIIWNLKWLYLRNSPLCTFKRIYRGVRPGSVEGVYVTTIRLTDFLLPRLS